MKKSKKINIAGFVLFFIGSVILQMYIETLLYIGLITLGIAWMFMDAHVGEITHEKHMAELSELRTNIDESLENMKQFIKPGELEEDETDYFDKKRSES